MAETSGKFNVFKDLINVLIDDKNNYLINVGVVINNKRNLFDLIDALLLGCSRSNNNVTVIRYSGNNVLRESKKLKIKPLLVIVQLLHLQLLQLLQ